MKDGNNKDIIIQRNVSDYNDKIILTNQKYHNRSTTDEVIKIYKEDILYNLLTSVKNKLLQYSIQINVKYDIDKNIYKFSDLVVESQLEEAYDKWDIILLKDLTDAFSKIDG